MDTLTFLKKEMRIDERAIFYRREFLYYSVVTQLFARRGEQEVSFGEGVTGQRPVASMSAPTALFEWDINYRIDDPSAGSRLRGDSMVTHVGGLTGSTLFSSPVDGEVKAARKSGSTTRDFFATAPGFDRAARLAGEGLGKGQKEQIVELVVAAVTVVADIVTLALSRMHQRDKSIPVSSPASPAVRPPAPLGHGTSPSPIPLTLPSPETMPTKRLEAMRSDTGDITVRTHDGYTVRADAVEGGWSITAPDGKTTRFTGGSQVRESDGGKWNVKGRSSFLFGAHKLTVNSSPRKNGAPQASSMTLYSGKERVTIGGLNTERPFLEAAAGDGTYHDDATNDGITYQRGQTKLGESWSTISRGVRRVMGGR